LQQSNQSALGSQLQQKVVKGGIGDAEGPSRTRSQLGYQKGMSNWKRIANDNFGFLL